MIKYTRRYSYANFGTFFWATRYYYYRRGEPMRPKIPSFSQSRSNPLYC